MENQSVLDELYKQGHEIGVGGVRVACPVEIYHNPDHSLRDAWIDGYMDGLKQYRRNQHLQKGWSVALHDQFNYHEKLYVEKKRGEIIIRDCEGGTILVRVRTQDAMVITEPQSEYSPMMAIQLGRAIDKAAGIAYRIQRDRVGK